MLDTVTVQSRVAAAAALDPITLEALIASAQAFLEQQTGRYFGPPASVTRVLTGTGGFLLYLTDRLESGTPTVIERAYPGATETAITDFEVRQGPIGTQLARTDGFWWRQGYEYEVAYTRGYALDGAPADILQTALDLIALRLAQDGLEGVVSGSVGAFSFSRGTGADGDLAQLPGAMATIRRWRRPVLV